MNAPYFEKVARGPAGHDARFVTAADGVRLRIALWPQPKAKGTVVMFPGRTEYVEKYSDAANEWAQRGYASAAIDWRGQGLSDRPEEPNCVGHVGDFAEFQLDASIFLETIKAANLPEPYFLMTHSMGGCIGLRTLMREHPYQAAVFSAPMWDIGVSPMMKIAGRVLSKFATACGKGLWPAPTDHSTNAPGTQPFEGNPLTTDPEMHQWMMTQLREHPELFLGNPSLSWLRAAFAEMDALAKLPSPQLPTHCWLGTSEDIVGSEAILKRMRNWDTGKLFVVDGAEHEVAMEQPHIRADLFEQSVALFESVI